MEELDRTVASFDKLKARKEELEESEDNLKEICKNIEEENLSLQEELEDSSYRLALICVVQLSARTFWSTKR